MNRDRQYVTLAAPGSARLESRRSVFIAASGAVASAAEAEAFVADQRERYPDARHHCYAWRSGLPGEMQQQKYSDDGEPSGTAGLPILSCLEGPGLTNAVVVVTRYFGGTLLGTGGLVHAYGSAAAQAVSAAGTVHMRLMRALELTVDYKVYDGLVRGLASSGWFMDEADYGARVSFTLWVPPGEVDHATARLNDLTMGSVDIQEGSVRYMPAGA